MSRFGTDATDAEIVYDHYALTIRSKWVTGGDVWQGVKHWRSPTILLLALPSAFWSF